MRFHTGKNCCKLIHNIWYCEYFPQFYFCDVVKARKSEAFGKYFWHLSVQANITVFSLNSKKIKKYLSKPSGLRYTIVVLQYAVCFACSLGQLFIKRPERMHGAICGVVPTSMWRDGCIDVGMTSFQTSCARSDAKMTYIVEWSSQMPFNGIAFASSTRQRITRRKRDCWYVLLHVKVLLHVTVVKGLI